MLTLLMSYASLKTPYCSAWCAAAAATGGSATAATLTFCRTTVWIFTTLRTREPPEHDNKKKG